jgi:hypothetical protein
MQASIPWVARGKATEGSFCQKSFYRSVGEDAEEAFSSLGKGRFE